MSADARSWLTLGAKVVEFDLVPAVRDLDQVVVAVAGHPGVVEDGHAATSAGAAGTGLVDLVGRNSKGNLVLFANRGGTNIEGVASAGVALGDTNLVLNAGDSISLTTGAASITMKKDGSIVISGKNITIDGSGAINIKANKNVVVKGQKILQN